MPAHKTRIPGRVRRQCKVGAQGRGGGEGRRRGHQERGPRAGRGAFPSSRRRGHQGPRDTCAPGGASTAPPSCGTASCLTPTPRSSPRLRPTTRQSTNVASVRHRSLTCIPRAPPRAASRAAQRVLLNSPQLSARSTLCGLGVVASRPLASTRKHRPPMSPPSSLALARIPPSYTILQAPTQHRKRHRQQVSTMLKQHQAQQHTRFAQYLRPASQQIRVRLHSRRRPAPGSAHNIDAISAILALTPKCGGPVPASFCESACSSRAYAS